MVEMGCGSPPDLWEVSGFVSVCLHGRADDKQGAGKGGGRLSKLINTLRAVIRAGVQGESEEHLQPLAQEFISVRDELLKADVPRAFSSPVLMEKVMISLSCLMAEEEMQKTS